MQAMNGRWYSSWTNYKENGRYVGQEWQNGWYLRTSGFYNVKKINDTTYNLNYDNNRNNVNGKIVMEGVDKFRDYYGNGDSELKTRSKKDTVSNLNCLFEDKRIVEEEKEKAKK
jgi:hypothetical protein